MAVPKLTEQDKSILAFVNMSITTENVGEAKKLLEALAVGVWFFATASYTGNVWEELDKTRQDLRKKQALDFDTLSDFQRETQNLLRDCISHREKQPSDLPWTKAKEIVRLRDERLENPQGAWPTRFDIQPWTTSEEIAQREKKLRKGREAFETRQEIANAMRESGKTLEEVHQAIKDQRKKNENASQEPLTRKEIRQAEKFIREPLSLEQGIAHKLGVSEADVKAVLEVFDAGNQVILDAYRKGQLRLIHAFRLAEMQKEGRSPDSGQEKMPEWERINLKDLEDDLIPRTVQNNLNERIMRCRLKFDFGSGRYEPGFVEFDRENLFPTSGEDRDPRIQAAPAIAEFLHRHAERLGLCKRSECRKFFVAKRKGKKRFCSDACKHLHWQKVRATTGYHRLDMRKRRDPNTPGFDKYIRQ